MNLERRQSTEAITELCLVAKEMLQNQLSLIEGVRKISALRLRTDDPNSQVFYPFRAIESETDCFVIGDERIRCDQDYLQRNNAEMATFLADSRQDILDACETLLRSFDSQE